MKKNPLVSVIVPCYNSEQWIAQALKSIFKQTYQNIEVIVIDDGSTDSTKETIDKYIKNNKVKYYYQKNQGPAAARNLGSKKATGDYIAFLDSDDLWENYKLEKQLNGIIENDADFSFSNTLIVDENNNLMSKNNLYIVDDKDYFLVQIFKGNYFNFISSSLLIRKKIFLDINGYNGDLRYREDHLFLMKLVEEYKYYFCDDYLVRIVKRDGSTTSFENVENIKKHYKLFLDKAISKWPFLKKYRQEVEYKNKKMFLKKSARKDIQKNQRLELLKKIISLLKYEEYQTSIKYLIVAFFPLKISIGFGFLRKIKKILGF